MRLILISDTHTMHRSKSFNKHLTDLIDPNQDNILIHAGDFSGTGTESQVTDFVYWYQNLKGFDTKIFIAGNHELTFESKPAWLFNYINEENLSQSDCVYLEDEEYIIQTPEFSRPIKIYGTPWQPVFLDWAFNLPRNGQALEEKWNKIPNDTDILISHCPPYGIGDYLNYKNLGCELLRKRVDKLNLLLNVFGHIHDGRGGKYVNDTLYVNASICTEEYYPVNKPFVVDLKEIDGIIKTNVIL